MTVRSTRSVSTSKMLAVLIGGLLAPVAMGLSLAVFPVGGAMLVYALVGGGFAFRRPDESWQWGLWGALGFFLASFLALTVVMAFGNSGLGVPDGSGFFEATLIFGLAPAVVGGCLGGMIGSMLSYKRYKLAGVAFVALAVAAGAIPFVG